MPGQARRPRSGGGPRPRAAQTQHCCDTTTREASALGYRPLFVTDAVETFDLTGPSGDRVDRDDINRITFATLSNGFATVLSFADLRATFASIKA